MRIGIYAQAKSSNGGVFRYTMTLLYALRTLDLDDDFVVLHGPNSDVPLRALIGGRWSHAVMGRRLMDIVREVGVGAFGERAARLLWYYGARLGSNTIVANPRGEPRFDRAGAKWYRDRGLDFVLYPAYSVLAFETRVPAVVTVHDLNHRIYTEFPEVCAMGEFERREYYFRNVTREAQTVLVESETGREDLLNFYADTGLAPERIVVLPMLPALTVKHVVSEGERVRVRERYGLAGDYFFYPAQFWPHKNHQRLVEALYHLKLTVGVRPTLVLSGSYSGSLRHRTFATVMSTARRLGVDQQVRYLGFIPDEDMSALYGEAAALVIPTFFGPTNIPVLEAFAVGCPVLTSDIRGIREQVDGAAILVDPRSPESIAEGLGRLLASSDARQSLIDRGREVLGRYTLEDYRRILARALEDAKARLCKPTRVYS